MIRLNRPGFVGDFILWKRGWNHRQKQQDRSKVFDRGDSCSGSDGEDPAGRTWDGSWDNATGCPATWYGVESVRSWVRQADIVDGVKKVVPSDSAAEIRQLEQENRELKRANEILRRAASFFGAELDRQQRL